MRTNIVKGTDGYIDRYRRVHTLCLPSGCYGPEPSTVMV